MTCRAGAKVLIDQPQAKGVVLEEYAFKHIGDFPSDWEARLTGLLSDSVLASSAGRFLLLADCDLSHFALSACQVNQHLRINDQTGTADDHALFNEETVPSETLFYAALTALRPEARSNALFDMLGEEQLVQFGGDSTTGLGFCSIKLA